MDKYEKLNETFDVEPIEVKSEKNVIEKRIERYETSKEDIRRAVQELWDVRVVKVRTQTRKGKPRRHKMAFGYTKDWKKAIVTLHDDDRISFF